MWLQEVVLDMDQKVVYYHVESLNFTLQDFGQRFNPDVNVSFRRQDFITFFDVNYIATRNSGWRSVAQI
jgi:hypothetical protein